MSELNVAEREDVRKAIDRPESVLLVRLKHLLRTDRNKTESGYSELTLANIHVTWSQLKYPALQALQVLVLYISIYS